MVQVWMRWCRLCARETRNADNSDIDVQLKDEEGLPLSDTIYKCFSIDIKDAKNFPKMICSDCYHHIKATINLNQRIPKVTAMFEELLLVKTEDDLDLNKVKARHNLDYDFKLFNQSPKEFAESNTFSEKETIYHQKTTLNPMTIKVEIDDGDNGDNYDNLISSNAENSNDSTSSENTNATNMPKTKKKYKSRKMRSTHDDTKPHYCSECKKGFLKFCNYRRHMQIAHETTLENKQQLFICGKCGKECKSISSLKQHEFSHAEERTFKCRNCEKAFKSSFSLKHHEDTHNETRYICVVCGLQLNTQQTLRKHMVVHSDEKNYKCDFCGNGYKRAKALKAHLILHTGLKPYACNFCDKTFANVSNCRGHKKKMHPVELAALEASGKNNVLNTVIPKLNELKAITAIKTEIIKPNDRGEEVIQDVFH